MPFYLFIISCIESLILQVKARKASSSDPFATRVQIYDPGAINQTHLRETWMQKKKVVRRSDSAWGQGSGRGIGIQYFRDRSDRASDIQPQMSQGLKDRAVVFSLRMPPV